MHLVANACGNSGTSAMAGREILPPGACSQETLPAPTPPPPAPPPSSARRPPGLTCVITPWLAFLRQPRPSLHNERVRKKPESSPHAQPPDPSQLGRAVLGRPLPPPRARRAPRTAFPGGALGPCSAQPARRGPPSVPPQPPDFLQPRTTERCACPSPRQRVVFMAPSGWPTPRLAPSTSAD